METRGSNITKPCIHSGYMSCHTDSERHHHRKSSVLFTSALEVIFDCLFSPSVAAVRWWGSYSPEEPTSMPLTRRTAVQSTGQPTWVINQPQRLSIMLLIFPCHFESFSNLVQCKSPRLGWKSNTANFKTFFFKASMVIQRLTNMR